MTQAVTSDSAVDAAPPGAGTPGLTPPTRADRQGAFLTDVIVEFGYADSQAVDSAEEAARQLGKTPEQCLLENGAIDEFQLARARAERSGLDHVDLDVFQVDAEAMQLIDRQMASRYTAVPIAVTSDGALIVAFEDPYDMLGIDDIEVRSRSEVRPAVAAGSQIRRLIEDIEERPPQVPRPAADEAEPIPASDAAPVVADEAAEAPPAPDQPAEPEPWPEPPAEEPPMTVEPEATAVAEEPVPVEPEATAVAEEPVPVEPEPTPVAEEPIVPVEADPPPPADEPAPSEPDPEPAAEQPILVEPEPEPVAEEPVHSELEPEPPAAEPEPTFEPNGVPEAAPAPEPESALEPEPEPEGDPEVAAEPPVFFGLDKRPDAPAEGDGRLLAALQALHERTGEAMVEIASQAERQIGELRRSGGAAAEAEAALAEERARFDEERAKSAAREHDLRQELADALERIETLVQSQSEVRDAAELALTATEKLAALSAALGS